MHMQTGQKYEVHIGTYIKGTEFDQQVQQQK